MLTREQGAERLEELENLIKGQKTYASKMIAVGGLCGAEITRRITPRNATDDSEIRAFLWAKDRISDFFNDPLRFERFRVTFPSAKTFGDYLKRHIMDVTAAYLVLPTALAIKSREIFIEKAMAAYKRVVPTLFVPRVPDAIRDSINRSVREMDYLCAIRDEMKDAIRNMGIEVDDGERYQPVIGQMRESRVKNGWGWNYDEWRFYFRNPKVVTNGRIEEWEGHLLKGEGPLRVCLYNIFEEKIVNKAICAIIDETFNRKIHADDARLPVERDFAFDLAQESHRFCLLADKEELLKDLEISLTENIMQCIVQQKVTIAQEVIKEILLREEALALTERDKI